MISEHSAETRDVDLTVISSIVCIFDQVLFRHKDKTGKGISLIFKPAMLFFGQGIDEFFPALNVFESMRSVQMTVEHDVPHFMSKSEPIARNSVCVDVFVHIDIFQVARGETLYLKLS